jgi:hypothetical protein
VIIDKTSQQLTQRLSSCQPIVHISNAVCLQNAAVYSDLENKASLLVMSTSSETGERVNSYVSISICNEQVAKRHAAYSVSPCRYTLHGRL